MTYGKKISQLRRSKNLTQQQLGDSLNVSAQAISKWEHDLAEPDLSTIKKMAALFEVSLDELLGVDAPTAETPVADTTIDTEKLTTDVTTTVKKVIEESTPEAPLGFCVVCGSTVVEGNKGTLKPKVMCKSCLAKEVSKRKNAEAEKERKLAEDREGLNKRRRRSLFFGSLVAIAIMIVTIFFMTKEHSNPGMTAATFFIGLLLCYVGFSLVSMFFLPSGIVTNIMMFFIAAPIRFHGVIFTLDWDGFVFFIAVKILFAILGFLIGCLLFFVGLVISAVVSPFVYPYVMYKTSRKVKGVIPLTKEDYEYIHK